MVVNPDIFRKIISYCFGYTESQTNSELNNYYFLGVLIAMSLPIIGPIIILIWKLNPEINPFANLLYWSVLMLVGSSMFFIFIDLESKSL